MTEGVNVFGNGFKLASEVVAGPGASQLLEGNIYSGTIHVIGGVLSRALLGATLGPVGVAGLMLNSYSKSTTGLSLLEHFRKPAEEPVAIEPTEQ
ncbi:MAG: hypothetical protein COA42_23295 [Alteromonadaceae bacterium]|nr:MAG: hypothetical protein COA42_23295 [Alteromonadaceae bacterium]